MLPRLAAIVLLSLSLAACQTPWREAKVDGPEAVLKGVKVADVKAALIARAARGGFMVTQDRDFQLQVEKPLPGADDGAAGAIPTHARVIYTMAQVGGDVRIMGELKLVTDVGSEHEAAVDMMDKEGREEMGRYLNEVLEAEARQAALGPPPPPAEPLPVPKPQAPAKRRMASAWDGPPARMPAKAAAPARPAR